MSQKYQEYDRLDLPEVATRVLEKWKTNAVFEASVTSREGKAPFVFFEGPPSANGLPGIHHVMARSIKDIFCRYKTLKGFQVHRKAGWDTHGLPVELGVEKELGITKEDIGTKISVEDYNKACREAVMRYTDIWNRAKVKDVFGTYRDASGQVWQIFNPLKAAGQVDRGVSMDYHRVHGYDLVITGPKSVVVEVQATHTMVSKANRRIAKVYQDEELNKYTLAPDGKLITDSSVKVFDLEGKPFLLTRTTSSEIKVAPKNWPPRLNGSTPRY